MSRRSASGSLETWMGVPGTPLAPVMGVSVLLPLPTTYAVVPSGAICTWMGGSGTEIAAPAVFEATLIGVTVLPAVSSVPQLAT